MQCDQAEKLFDAYLAGELPPSLETELGAHRLRCADCRRSLALLEVSGHVIASDGDRVEVGGDFTDRLMACMAARRSRWLRARRWMYVGGPLAAAAVIVLAFLGVFDPRLQVAGEKVVREQAESPACEDGASYPEGVLGPGAADESVLRAWLEQTQRRMAAKRESGASLQQALDSTLAHVIEAMRKAKESSDQTDRSGADAEDDRSTSERPSGPTSDNP